MVGTHTSPDCRRDFFLFFSAQSDDTGAADADSWTGNGTLRSRYFRRNILISLRCVFNDTSTHSTRVTRRTDGERTYVGSEKRKTREDRSTDERAVGKKIYAKQVWRTWKALFPRQNIARLVEKIKYREENFQIFFRRGNPTIVSRVLPAGSATLRTRKIVRAKANGDC